MTSQETFDNISKLLELAIETGLVQDYLDAINAQNVVLAIMTPLAPEPWATRLQETGAALEDIRQQLITRGILKEGKLDVN